MTRTRALVALTATVAAALVAAGLLSWAQPAPGTEVTAGAEVQPVGQAEPDGAAAEAEIRQAYFDAFDHSVEREAKLAAMEGGAAAHASQLDRAAANFPTAVATVTVEVREVSILLDDWATVRFELFYDGGAEFGEQTGSAVLDEGRWVVARETMCMVYGWAGAGC